MKKLLPLILLIALITAQNIEAQSVRKSQKGIVTQKIANTEISLEYHRPVARGRVLFGENGIVKFDKIWMPGANEATTIEVSEDIEINGSELKKGKYSVWSIPNEEEWTIIFSKKWDAWHSRYPEGEDELRVKAYIEEGSHMEVLAYYFPEVTEESAVLRLHWGSTVIPLDIKL
ncbi:MAG: DUF2911 domain-containing protein [Balneolaceae bacterium]